MLSTLLGIGSEVELLDHMVLRCFSACDGEDVHILRNGEVILAYPWFSLTLCDRMDCSTPGFPVLHRLLQLAQTHVH